MKRVRAVRTVLVGVASVALASSALTASATGAGAAGGSVTVSTSRLIVDAQGAKPITIRAHIVDPNPLLSAPVAVWTIDPTVRPSQIQDTSVPMTLVSGSATNGTWAVSTAPRVCGADWHLWVEAQDAQGSLIGTADVLVVQNLPDTVGPAGWVVAKTSIAAPVAPGSKVEFTSVLSDTAECGASTSGVKSVAVTARLESNPAVSAAVAMHLAVELSNPNLYWDGVLSIPAGAPAGVYQLGAVATDNSGNIGNAGVIPGTLTVS